MTYSAAVVGCGRIGCGFDDDPKRTYTTTHAKAYTAVSGVRLTALVDSDPAKLQRYTARYGVKGYSSLAELLAEQPTDIVSICTWTASHHALVKQAVEGGVKAIFCEKPLADTLAHADAMIALCEEHGVLLLVDHQRRFDPLHQQLKAHLRDGKLGTIQNATFRYTAGIANTGSHMFDLLRFFFGDADWVMAVPSRAPSGKQEDPNFDGLVQFKSGPLCAVQACDVNAHLIFELDIVGTTGRVRLTHSGFDLDYYSVGESRFFSGYKELFPAPPPLDAKQPREFMLNAVRHLVDCLDGKTTPVSTGRDGRAALELICAFQESARQGGQLLKLPLAHSDVTVA